MNKPSSTITAATLAGAGMTFMWGMVNSFTTFTVDAVTVAASVTLASALVGYFKKENVLPLK